MVNASVDAMAVADAVDAMSASRVYRVALPKDEIVHELERGRGTQWDPAIVDHTLRLVAAGEITFARDGLELADASPSAAVLRFPSAEARRNRQKRAAQ